MNFQGEVLFRYGRAPSFRGDFVQKNDGEMRAECKLLRAGCKLVQIGGRIQRLNKFSNSFRRHFAAVTRLGEINVLSEKPNLAPEGGE